MGFNDGGQLAIYIREAAAPHAQRLLAALPKRQRDQAIMRCAAAFEAAANAKGGSKILGCNEGSIIRAVLHCALIDLYPGGVQPGAYLIPRGSELTVLVSFHGMRDLALRSGNRNIQARAVFEGEDFRLWVDEEGEHVTHEMRHDVERDWSTLVAVYCMGERPDGTRGVEMLGRSQVEARREASQSKTGPWSNWPVEMALKTVVKYSISRGTFPIADRFALALDEDSAPQVIEAPKVATAKAPASLAEHFALEDHGEQADPLEGINEVPEPVPVKKRRKATKRARAAGPLDMP